MKQSNLTFTEGFFDTQAEQAKKQKASAMD